MNLEDVCMIFHEAEDCPGLIVSDWSTGELMCAECRQTVGKLDPLVLREIVTLLSRLDT